MKRSHGLPLFSDIPDPLAMAVATPARPPRRPKASAPSRARLRYARTIAFAAAAIYEVFWLVVLKAHDGGRPKATIALAFLIPFVASAGALSVAIRRGARGLGEPVTALASGTCGALLLFVGGTLLLSPADQGAFWRDAVGCMGVSALLAVGPLALALHAFRGAFASASTWRALALGTACGGLATMMMSVVCPVGSRFHVLLGHGTAMVVSGLVGALLGRRLARA